MKLLVAGDMLPYDRVAKLFDQKQYERVLGQIRGYVQQSDYSIVNFECPICQGDEKPIEKCGPSHKCTDAVIAAIQYAGFHCVTLANNHFRDYGDEGCRNTLRLLDENGIDHVGGGMNINEAARILYREVDGKRLAIVNCCEHEFSIATDTLAGSNPLNPVMQFYAIRKARQEADYVQVIVHGGHEHYQLPSPRMQETYRFFIDAGADVVVNHHQHCFSGYEVYNDKPIFYGLGNFCFDKPVKRADKWNEGYLVQLSLMKDTVSFALIPYIQNDKEPTITPMTGYRKTMFNNKIKELNTIITDPDQLKTHFEALCQKKLPQKESLFSPYYGSVFAKLYAKKLIPSINSTKRMLALTDHIVNESHRDTTLHFFKTTL